MYLNKFTISLVFLLIVTTLFAFTIVSFAFDHHPETDRRPPGPKPGCCHYVPGSEPNLRNISQSVNCIDMPIGNTSNVYGINIDHPNTWSISNVAIQDNNAEMVLSPNLSPDRSINNITSLHLGCKGISDIISPYLQIIAINSNLSNISTSQLLNDTIKFFNTKIQMQNMTATDQNIANHSAYKLEYDTISDDQIGSIPVKVMEIGVVIDNKIYYFDFLAGQGDFDKLLPDINEMINHIQINNQSIVQKK